MPLGNGVLARGQLVTLPLIYPLPSISFHKTYCTFEIVSSRVASSRQRRSAAAAASFSAATAACSSSKLRRSSSGDCTPW